jgi:hypothetical protein
MRETCLASRIRSATEDGTLVSLRCCLRVFGQEAVSVDDGGGNVEELAVGVAGVVAEHLEGGRFVDGVAFHVDALSALGYGAAPEGAFEIVVFGEAAQHDVDRALPFLGVGVGDVREDAPLGRLLDETPP